MKRATRANKLVVGAFALGMAVVIGAATLFFGDSLSLFKRSSRYFASFKNAAGLHVGAPLKMGGVDIGSVEAIAIDTDGDTPKILLTLMIYAPHNDLIKADSELSLDTQGMLGDKFLNLSTGTADAAKLSPGDFLKTKESTEMSMVVSQSSEIIKNVAATTVKIDTFVDSLPDAAAMKTATTDFGASAQELKALLSVLNARDSAIHLMGDKVFADRLLATVGSLQRAAQHFESVAAKIDSGQGSLGALVNDPALYDDMRNLLGRANRSKTAKFIIHEMLEDPSRPSGSGH